MSAVSVSMSISVPLFGVDSMQLLNHKHDCQTCYLEDIKLNRFERFNQLLDRTPIVANLSFVALDPIL